MEFHRIRYFKNNKFINNYKIIIENEENILKFYLRLYLI